MAGKRHGTFLFSLILVFVLCSPAMSAFQGKVAIIGGGISGLSCARRLQVLGIESVVFDTGKKNTGGRCSSRNLQVDGQTYIADHSSQFFTATSDLFKSNLQAYKIDGSIMEWDGKMVQIASPGVHKTIDVNPDKPRYVGKAGMGSFSRKMSETLDIKRPVWVSKMERCKQNPERWRLYQYNDFLGTFDVVVVAHNGKCADRLLSTADVPRIHNLLKVNFGDTLPQANKMRKMQLCSLWVAVFAVRGSLPVDFEGAYVSHGKTLSWMCNNTKKMAKVATTSSTASVSAASNPVSNAVNNADDAFPALSSGSKSAQGQGQGQVVKQAPVPFSYAAAASKLTPKTPEVGSNKAPVVAKTGGKEGLGEGVECWTLTSTREFGSANKVPQENVPPEKEREIASKMIRAMEEAAGLPSGSIVPLTVKVQLWGAAVPMNRHSAPFLVDGPEGVAVCGDWFNTGHISSGPSIETAFLSGSLLADAVSERFRAGSKKDFGLEADRYFEACAGHPLGDVPVLRSTAPSTTGGKKGPALGSLLTGPPSTGRNACDTGKPINAHFTPTSTTRPTSSSPSSSSSSTSSTSTNANVSVMNGKRVWTQKK